MKKYNYSHQHPSIIALFLIAVFVLSVTLVHWGLVQTVTAQNKTEKTAKGLTISPLRTEISISPGTSFSGNLKVTNSTDKPMTVSFSVEEFKVINAKYDYEFIAESNLTQWVSFATSEVNLKAGESKKIKYTVGAPLTTELGGYYISLFASTIVGSPGDDGNSRERVASLLYITVGSDVLGAEKTGRVLSVSSPWLVISEGTWGMTIQNAGTAHFRSNYNVSVDNLFGGTIAKSQGSALILPNTIRAISETLPLPSLPGIYKIVFRIGLGDKSDAVETRYMIFLPLWALSILTIIIVIAGYWLFRKLNKKH